MDPQQLALFIKSGGSILSYLIDNQPVRLTQTKVIETTQNATITVEKPPEKPALQVGVSTQDTIDYQKREISKELLLMEKHLQQKCKINGTACDCLTPGQTIFTENGMMPIENILASTVLTHAGNNRAITRRFQRQYSGSLKRFRMNQTNVPLWVTPEHPMYVIEGAQRPNWKLGSSDKLLSQLNWIKAKYVSEHDVIAFPRIATTVDLPEVSEDIAEVLGWYVAEGMLDKQSGHRIIFSLGKKEKDNHDRLLDVLKKVSGSPVHRYERPTGLHIGLSDPFLYRLCQSFGFGARKKIMPTWFLKLDKEKQWRFLIASIHGDGWIQKSGSGHGVGYTTTSESLAVGLRILAYRLGLIHRLGKGQINESILKGRTIVPNGARWDITFHGEAVRTIFDHMGHSYKPSNHTNTGLMTEDYVLIPIRSVEESQYEGPVHNIAVDGDESFLTIHGALHNCCKKHPMAIEALSQEALGMTGDKVYSDLVEWTRVVTPMTTPESSASGKYEDEYPKMAVQARELRKKIMGTTDLLPLLEPEQRKKLSEAINGK